MFGAAALLLSAPQPAEAVLITKVFTGKVTFVDPSSPLGVGVGSPIHTSVTYDDALLTGTGYEYIEVDGNPAFDVAVTFGSLSFVASDDDLFGSGYPELGFLDGRLVTVDFNVPFSFGDFQNLVFSVFDDLEILDTEDGDRILLAGTLGLTAVPEPGTLSLIGLGLAAFGLIRRRCA